MSATEYDDLQLRIDRDADGSYRVLAMAPDGRTARGSFIPPMSDSDLDDFVQRVGLARRRRGAADARMQAITELGSDLFEALIKDEVGTVYYSARGAAAERDRGLRITLRLSGSPELMRLPWEFLYKRPRFIAQSIWTPVVRALDVDSAMHPQKLRLPLRILAMVSSPSGYPELDAEAERRNLERALSGPRAAGLVEVTWLDRATLGELGRRIAEPDEIHVLHYIGHGAYDEATEAGVLVLETPHGRAHDVSGDEIGAMLQDETSLRLVVLNACEGARSSHVDPFSGVATSLVNFDIPAVIGMQFEITDDAAIAFSESLYTGLARGLPIDAALAPARRAIIGAMVATEFGTPVLFLRDGEARLFDVMDAPTEAPAPAASTEATEPMIEEGDEVADAGAEEPVTAKADGMRPLDEVPMMSGAGPEPATAEEPSSEDVDIAPVEENEAVPTAPVPPAVEGSAVAPAPARSEEASSAIPRPEGGRPTPTPRTASSVAAPIALAWTAAALLALGASMSIAVWIQWSVGAGVAQYFAQGLAVTALSLYHLIRRDRDRISAALYAIAAVASLFAVIVFDSDYGRVAWANAAVGLALIGVGIRLWAGGARRPPPFTPSARVPAPFVAFAGVGYLFAAMFLFDGEVSDWDPVFAWTWPFGMLALAAGYVLSAQMLAREQRTPQAGRDGAGSASAGRGGRVATSVALAGIGAALLAYTAWMLIGAVVQPADAYQLAPAAFLGQTLAFGALSVHHLTRPNGDSVPASVGYAIAAGVSVVTVSNALTDLEARSWGDAAALGIILVAVGAWLVVVGKRGASSFAASLRAPAPFVIAVGAAYLIAAVLRSTGAGSWSSLVEWIILPIAALGMATGYVISAVLLARKAATNTDPDRRQPVLPSDG